MIHLVLKIHLVLMSLAFAVFTVSFLIGFVFLLQESRIKSRHFDRLSSRLPSLERMDSIHTKALTAGFLLLSGGILAGSLLSKLLMGKFISGDPKQLTSLVMWALYALFLNIRLRVGWRGRKGILLSLIGFAAIVLTFLGVSHRI